MAQFCSIECEKTGSICDFCHHYKDEYRDILKLINPDGSLKFSGSGICSIDGSETDACSGSNCADFECFNL